jgi:Dinucleotide-utilizing enzymes involved in molybdopterin and thiamine biosynthesis family 2
MIYSAAIASGVNDEAIRHLIRRDGQEDLCFALWYPSQGTRRFSGLVESLILPRDGERAVHGNASFTSAYFERALAVAEERGCGLALMHSHPATGWQGMSRDDIHAEQTYAPTAFGATGLPLLGLTAGTDEAWSARFWVRTVPKTYERHWCESVRVVGERLAVTFNDALRPAPAFHEELTRTVSAWGESAQGRLARLRVGVIGLGSVGSMVAESIARMGVSEVLLMDFDVVKRHNLDRLMHATRDDAERGTPKVRVLERVLPLSATASDFAALPLEYSVVEEEGFRAALDCDVLFSCVDRPWPRNVLNFIAYAHLIPVVDGGIHAVMNRAGKGLRGAEWLAHVAAPTRRCLECLRQYTPEDVSLERIGLLDDPTYIEGLPKESGLRRNENVFAFSMNLASMEVLQLLSMVVLPRGFTDAGGQMYDFLHAELRVNRCECSASCLYPPLIARGDRAGVSFVGEHPLAREARATRHTAAAPLADPPAAVPSLAPVARRPWFDRLRDFVMRRQG